MARYISMLALLGLAYSSSGQLVVWAEEFENGCTQNCPATGYAGPNGNWTAMPTGANGACANIWFVSCQENGNAVGACGSGCGTNETLHIGNNAAGCTSPNSCFFCPSGDCGAAYDASCPPGLCSFCCSCQSSQTATRAVSPVIDLTGLSAITLRFKYMEGGAGSSDNALLDYFDGTAWSQLVDLPKTPTAGCGGQGIWTAYSIALPASANNNPGVRIGFRWVNNDDGSGTDPSVAIDDVELTVPYAPACPGLLVNEVSNGANGTQEYVELLACATDCQPVDLRLWKIDDNNGVLMNGFGTSQTGSGTSAGHLRFSNAAQWASVPAGAMIVIYNNADPNPLLPPNDPSDTAPNDSVYVLPANHALLQGCSSLPNATGSANYGNACVFGGGNWSYVGLRNEGDAIQTRTPQGRYFHGISYGPNAQSMNGGGLDLLRISTLNHTGRVLFFNSGNERLAANFTSAPIAGNETPGSPNNAANAAYIENLLCSTLPVELLFFTAEPIADRVTLRWATATEHNSALFVLDRSRPGGDFALLAEQPAAGHSQNRIDYRWDDLFPLPGTTYYRLRQEDLDGTPHLGPVVAVTVSGGAFGPMPVEGESAVWLPAQEPGTMWRLLDATGRVLASGTATNSAGTIAVPTGWNILEVRSVQSQKTYRLAATTNGLLVSPGR
ncbi:MAG TPA: hypothetical protein PKH36_10220 [Flavobacteriales bacterium]|nr:hypothetical protein [Flavobacteriales bacterium]